MVKRGSPTLTAYGGVREVGGNKVLLEDGEQRLMFDFGKAFGRYGSYFDGVYIRDRVGRGLLDPLSLGLIPPLRGLLREDLVPTLDPGDLDVTEQPAKRGKGKPKTRATLLPRAVEGFWEVWKARFGRLCRDLRRSGAPAVDVVLLSHAHQDHISDLQFVSAEVPAASTRLTAFISKVLLDTGIGASGAPYLAPRTPKATDGMLEADRNEPYAARPWAFLEPEPGGEVGADPLASAAAFWSYTPSKRLGPRPAADLAGLRIQHWDLDHSLYGAAGFAVETSAGWVAYTGDLRFHGARKDRSWAFAQALAKLRPAVLVCEGTRLTQANDTTESTVFENCLQAVKSAAGKLVVADSAPRNIERLQLFLRIAEETDRVLLVQPKDAYLLRAMHLADPSAPDLMEHPHLGLYADPKVSPQNWEKLVRERYDGKTYSPQQVTTTPGQSMLAFSLTDLADMNDLHYLMEERGDGIYIFSNSRAYDDEQMVDLVRLWNWTQHLRLQVYGLEPKAHGDAGEVKVVEPVPGYHASGHAGVDELSDFVRLVRPRKLVAIHTEVPEAWKELLEGTGVEVVLPEYGEPIEL